MIDLPETTNVYRRMPKELFYKYLNDDCRLKKTFADEIISIIWINTLSFETFNTLKGRHVSEIAIVEINLNRQAINPSILEIINREIDQYAVFVIRYEEWGQIWCCDHQSLSVQMGQLLCQNYYQTNWISTEDLTLKIDGENLDQVYENFFIQIVGKPFPAREEQNENQTEEVTGKVVHQGKSEQLEKLETIIRNLENQMAKERQFAKQVKLVTELNNARDEMKIIKQSMSTHIEIHQPDIIETQAESAQMVRSFYPNVSLKMQGMTGKRFDYSLI